MKNVFCLCMVCVLLLLSGCASAPKVVGTQRIVESSLKQQPEWMSAPFSEDKKAMYFSGIVKGVGDYSVGLRQAKAEALKNVAESIQTKVRTEFVENTRGANISPEDLGKFVQDGVAMVADNIQISGLLPVENYYEKVEEVTQAGVKYFYNCSVLVQLSISDYKIARTKAIEGLAAEAREKKDKEAEEAAMKLLEKLD